MGLLLVTLSSCSLFSKLPDGVEFSYHEGEVVYYKVDNMPMLIEKQIIKKGEKFYLVIFKNSDGVLMENTLPEEELQDTPPLNRAKI